MITSLPATSPPESPPARGVATPWKRGAAWLVDVVTVLFVNLGLVLVGTAPLVDAAVDRWSPDPWGNAFVPTVVYAAIFLVYETVFVAVRGQTPGMDLLEIEVVDGRTGEHPHWRRAFVRTLPLVALRLVPGALVGTAAMLAVAASVPFDWQRRGLHDLLSGTRVVDVSDDSDGDDADESSAIDRDELADTYGPRRLIDFIRHRR